MKLLLEIINTYIYFLCVKNIGELFLGYKRKFLKNTYISLIVLSILTAMIMLYTNVWIKIIAHIISVLIVSYICFKENFKNILGLYFGTTVVISMISDLFDVAVMQLVVFLKIGVIDGLIRVLDLFFTLLCICVIGTYFYKKYGNELKNIGTRYWLLFISIMFFDASVMTILGDFIINTMQAGQKNLIVFLYCGVIIGLLIQLVLLINTLVTRNVHKENEKLAKQFLENQNEHYQYLEKREYETKKFRHDIKNHLLLLENLLNAQKYEEVEAYLNTINDKVSAFSNQISVNNGIADAILNRFYTEAKQKGITLKVNGHFPMECYITAYDICTVFSNLLSNAIRAELETEGREVLVNIKYTDDKVLLTMENDYVNELYEVDGVFKTTKEDSLGHGYGLSNVKECVEQNGGYLTISTENHRFKVMVMMLNEEEGML